MDAKDLRTETTIGDRSNNGTSKFTQGGASAGSAACNSSKTFENMSANPLAKLETPTSRPCAVIGPDRIVPPPTDVYSKKSHYEPWLHVDNTYRQLPEYPHKVSNYQSPIRNISPRQTFQENMQRIMVQPTYNSVKLNDDPNYTLDRNTTKNSKITGPHDPKYCDVPYSVNPISSDQKPNEMCVTNMNSSRNYPQMWHPGSVGIRPARPYGAPEVYQFPEYTSCAGPRPMPMPRPHRTMNEDPSHAYGETYYPEGNIRFKPYPTVKERFPHARYEYVSNYAHPFHPPPHFPSHKYDMQKPLPPHVAYPQVPMKYLENRMPDTIIDGYQRPQPVNYNAPYRNQVMHPAYGPMIASNIQNKVYPYPPDGSGKPLASNKLPYDSKLYAEFENARNKGYPVPDNVYLNEMVRPHIKNQPVLPNYPVANMQQLHAHPYYRKENLSAKNYEYISHLRHLDPSLNPNSLTRLSTQFSPNSIAISPSDSNTSNETSHTHGGSLEDCGYVSQSSATSIRSYDSSFNRMMANDFQQRYNYPYQTMIRTSPLSSKPGGNGIANPSKDKKGIDVRQFLQMWNEGEEDNSGKEKEVVAQTDFNPSKLGNQYEVMKNHEQLYVLGLVNVPSEELEKYEHIQKISKLPENIKGYNNIELLKHFEEALESSNMTNQNHKPPTPRNYHSSSKSSLVQGAGLLPPRPISPLDVEAKISQSVIHKEVGCNFEIKPCSPEMLNAEVATTAQSILGEERVIEKVSNTMIVNSPILNTTTESEKNSDILNQKEHRVMLKEDVNKIPSCKMINTQYSNNESLNVTKTNYSLQELESNAGVCLASLPRLDNDIELNFPEVNQQFINANKESVIIANDFTTELNSMSNNDNYKLEENIISNSKNSSVTPILELEKEVTKLSKYRKIKRNEVECKENQFLSVSQSLRTDSVIIKNPENIKCLEKNTGTPPLDKKADDYHTLQLNDNSVDNSAVSYKTTDIIIDTHEDANEIAIDFSFSRENKVCQKQPKNYCEIDSTKTFNLSPDRLLTNNQAEDKNTTCLSDCINDITMKTSISNEVGSLKLHPVSQDIEKSNEINLKTHDFKEYDADMEPIGVDSENLSNENVNTDAKNGNAVGTSTADQTNLNNHDFLKLKNEIVVYNQLTTPITEIDKKTCLSPSSIDTNSIQSIEEKVNSADVFCGDFNMKNDVLSSIDRQSTVVELDCKKVNEELSKQDVTDETKGTDDITIKSQLSELVENKEPSNNSILRKFKLNKEMFSPRIQNLLLWNEGQNYSILTYHNKSTNYEPLTDSSENSNKERKENNIKDNAFNDSKLEVIAVDNLISKHELKSEFQNIKDCMYSNTDKAVTNVGPYNSVEDCTMDSSICDSGVKIDCLESETNFSNSQFPVSDLCVEADDLENVDKFTDNTHQSKPNVKIMQRSNLNNFTVTEFEVESVVDKSTISGTSLDISTVKSFEKFDVCSNSGIQLDSINAQHRVISGSKMDISQTDTLNRECDNNKQTKLIEINDYLNSDSAIESSAADNINPLESSAGDKYESAPTDVMVSSVLDVNVKSVALDNIKIFPNSSFSMNNIENNKEMANSEFQSESVGVKDYTISDKDVDFSPGVTPINSIKYCSDSSDLPSELAYAKNCMGFESDANQCSQDNFNIFPELQTDGTDVEIEHISDSNKSNSEVSSPIRNKNFINNSELQTDSSNVDILPTIDLNLIKTFGNVVNFARDEIPTKSFNCKTSRHLIESELENELENTKLSEELCSTNNVLLDTKDLNQCVNSDMKDENQSNQIDCKGDSYEEEQIAQDSGVHDVETETSFILEQVTEVGVLHDSIAGSEQTLESGLCDININKGPEDKPSRKSHIRRGLKRSLSDSALNFYHGDKSNHGIEEEIQLHNLITKRHRKNNDLIKVCEPNFSSAHVLSLHNNRRNSVTSIYNEDNMSFCIVIDNNCIITGENAETEKMCYTELGEECLTSINTDNYEEENVDLASEIIICPQDNIDEYNEPLVFAISDEKSLEESWVDDVACVETVVSDDIAEDIELSAPSSPREPDNEKNDESDIFIGVSDHTNKVKYIYGDNLCNDDAELVETLYRTPQMNVNKTLSDRESHVSDDDEEFHKENPINDIDGTQGQKALFYRTDMSNSSGSEQICKDDISYDEEFHKENPINDIYGTQGQKALFYRTDMSNSSGSEQICKDDDEEFHKENPINDIDGTQGQKALFYRTDMSNSSGSEQICKDDISYDVGAILDKPMCSSVYELEIPVSKKEEIELDTLSPISCKKSHSTVHSCESSVHDALSCNQEENSRNCSPFSSPEVSSTTSEEKNTSLLLKITNCEGTRTSQLNELILSKPNSCKFTENINYTNFISNSTEPRPLITKAAQKYIPPIKETVSDLKVKLPLPRDSLLKFKQLKITKSCVRHNSVSKKDIPIKIKPKFEDVLKSIDELQFKMHRDKSKKPKKSVPKVVIKKTENGSHYTSTPNRDCFNPDLTGRKWQPWVFIEKSSFIDKMALRRKTKAIYNHRKNTYVFADKFKKYKSMPSAKFVITQPKLDDPSVGQLKYTIRLKHTY